MTDAHEQRGADGRFNSGNAVWKMRADPGGRPLIFETPDILCAACIEYFEWVKANPLYEDKLVTFQGTATHEPVAKMRAMTKEGLCLYLGIGFQTWRDYVGRSDFSEVTSWAEMVIRVYKFEGAAADLLSPNIIARDLGLSEKSESKVDMGEDTLAATLKAVRGE